MRLACANAVLAVHCNYFVEVPKQKTGMNCMYVHVHVIQNWLLALREHFIHVRCLGTSNNMIY